jgi:hypothetical protein
MTRASVGWVALSLVGCDCGGAADPAETEVGESNAVAELVEVSAEDDEEQPPVELPPETPTPRVGVIALHPGFVPDPRVLEARTELTLDALTADCVAPETPPDYVLMLDNAITRLRLLAKSSAQIRLAVATPDATTSCSLAEPANEVEIASAFPRGASRVWVASARTGERYRLGLTELANVGHSRLTERAPDRPSRVAH